MSFTYIIKHNLKGRPIFVKDLGPDGWQSMPPRNFYNEMEKLRMLHYSFTEEQIKNSQGLRQALSCGWFTEVEIKFSNNDNNNETVNELKNEISDLKMLISQLVENKKNIPQENMQVIAEPPLNSQTINSLDMEILSKIAKDLKDIKTKTMGVEIDGYEELSPAMAALQARKDNKIQLIKDNNLKIERKEVDVNINEILNNLDDLD